MYSGSLIDELFDPVEKVERSAGKDEAAESARSPAARAKTRANIAQHFREENSRRELQPK
jgi:hypothetical protein